MKNKIKYRRENLVIIQKTVRMHFARKRHRPRYQGIVKVKKLGTQITAMGQTVQKLKKDREVSQKEVQSLQSDLNQAVIIIKVSLTTIIEISSMLSNGIVLLSDERANAREGH